MNVQNVQACVWHKVVLVDAAVFVEVSEKVEKHCLNVEKHASEYDFIDAQQVCLDEYV